MLFQINDPHQAVIFLMFFFGLLITGRFINSRNSRF